MRKVIFAAVVAMAMAPMGAMANGASCPGNGDCTNVGNTTNNNNTTNEGGTGIGVGFGGKGGDATSVAVGGFGGGATVGDVTARGGSARQGQLQGQKQGQGQQQNAVSGSQSGASAKSSQGNQQNINTSNEAADLSKMVPSIGAPALTTTLSETCMGSSSGGVAGSGFGLTFGSTWTDEECVRRLNARELRSMGFGLAGKELMCENPSIRASFERAAKASGNKQLLCQASADSQQQTAGTVNSNRYVETANTDRIGGDTVVHQPAVTRSEVASSKDTWVERNHKAWENMGSQN